MKFMKDKQEENLEKALNTIKEISGPDSKFLITFHALKDQEIKHYYQTNDFPNSDLMICLNYLENEFVKVLKKGATGNGRM